MKNKEGYPDPTAGRAIREADRPPEHVVMFRRDAQGNEHHLPPPDPGQGDDCG